MGNLVQVKERLVEKNRLKNLLEKVLAEKKELHEKYSELELILKKEFDDVEKLEKTSLTSVFYSFLGTKVEKLDKERQEYLAAKLKWENSKNEIEKLAAEIRNIRQKLAELGDPEQDYANHLQERKKLAQENNDPKFIEFDQLLKEEFKQKREINEAIDAGEMALNSLRLAIQALRKAQNWGTFDMLGGGFLATAVKHSNIDEARQLVQDTQVWLSKFKRELADIAAGSQQNLEMHLDDFSTFADYFFDNLIFDWVVQTKINDSLQGCEAMYKNVLDLVTQLKVSDLEISKSYKSTKQSFYDFLEKSIQ